jgi:hypothetical protein
MLLEFRVKNFKSFKDETIFSMEATADKSHPDNVITEGKFKALKTSVIFGANASGKTKLIEAMGLMRGLVTRSLTHTQSTQLPYFPFIFDDVSKNEPTTFGIKFTNEEILYDYHFSYNSENIIDEVLKYYPKNKAATIFERHDQKFIFVNDKAKQRMISEAVKENVLYLSVSSQLKYAPSQEVFEWFQKFLVITNGDPEHLIEILIKRMESDHSFETRVLKALRIADFGITSLMELEGEVKNTSVKPQKSSALSLQDVWLTHNATNKNGENIQVELPMYEESSGTVNFISMIGPVIDTILGGTTLVVDEIDLTFHSDLSKWIIGLFHNPKENPNGAQLIFNTHDTNLLNQNLIRRDQVWFVEKNWETGTSTISSLSEFKVRKDKNIEDAYLSGRYRAVPFISNERLME